MIVITTPAGNIGRQVLEDLLDSGEQLRLVARDLSGIPADALRPMATLPWPTRHSTARTRSSG
jgi:uncharacterized protein YbjT (DUF2867 family)